jgi:hypothetical protein
LPEESVVVVCPNPKCRRQIEEPILLTIRSVTPPKQYEACPYCFTNLEPEPPVEQEDAPEPTVEQKETAIEEEDEAVPTVKSVSVLEKVKGSGPRFLQKVKALIPSSNGSQKEEIEKTEEPKAEPATKKEEKPTKKETEPGPSIEKLTGFSGCTHTFGYLAHRHSETPIPPECLLCPKIVDCMLRAEE